MVPNFATAHTFCASRDGPRKLDFLTAVPAKTDNFCAVYKYAGKADLDKGNWNPKRKSEVTTHFSEIIKFQFGKKNSIPCCVVWRFLELMLLNYL